MTHTEKAVAVAEAHEILGISHHAELDEIRQAWKRRAFELHPDRGVGTDEDLSNVNSAYQLLQERAVKRQARPRVRPRNADEGRRTTHDAANRENTRRPRVVTRIVDFSQNDESTCRDLLEQVHDTATAATHNHYACAVRRKGRRVTFVVDTPLRKGTNRVAVPGDELDAYNKSKPKLVVFKTGENGPGTLIVPEDLRKRLFPDAREVQIQFALREFA